MNTRPPSTLVPSADAEERRVKKKKRGWTKNVDKAEANVPKNRLGLGLSLSLAVKATKVENDVGMVRRWWPKPRNPHSDAHAACVSTSALYGTSSSFVDGPTTAGLFVSLPFSSFPFYFILFPSPKSKITTNEENEDKNKIKITGIKNRIKEKHGEDQEPGKLMVRSRSRARTTTKKSSFSCLLASPAAAPRRKNHQLKQSHSINRLSFYYFRVPRVFS